MASRTSRPLVVTAAPGPRKRTGRPPGRRNSIPYRSGVAREILTLRIPPDATPEVKAIGEKARALIEKALRSKDPGVFCLAARRPRGVSAIAFRFRVRVAAALYVLQAIARPENVIDVLADMRAEEDPSS